MRGHFVSVEWVINNWSVLVLLGLGGLAAVEVGSLDQSGGGVQSLGLVDHSDVQPWWYKCQALYRWCWERDTYEANER